MPQSKYWSLGGQTVAIVASILMAFAIQAWWEEQQEAELEARLLKALEVETYANIAEIETNSKYRTSMSAVCDSILAAAPEQISAEEFDAHLADLLWWSVSNFSVAALSTLVDGGELSQISDPRISLQISRITNLLGQVTLLEDEDRQTSRFELVPLLYSSGSFPQLSNIATERGEPGIGDWTPSPPVPDKGGRDHRAFLSDDKFRGIVVLKKWAQEDVLTAYVRLEASFNELLEILKDA